MPSTDHTLVTAVKMFIFRYEQRILARGITVAAEDCAALVAYAENADLPASGRTEEVVLLYGHLEELRVNLVPVDAQQLGEMAFEAEKRFYAAQVPKASAVQEEA